jgi:hypothetical protein
MRLLRADESFKEGVNLTFALVPGKAVAKGDKWTRPAKMPLSVFGGLEGETEFTYLGPSKEGEQVSFTTRWTHIPPKGVEDFLLKVSKGDIKAEPTKGTLLFDPTTGRLVRLEQTVWLKGDFIVATFGTLHAEQVSAMTIRVMNRKPLK